ncbi:MAG: hypothetical protein Q9164_000924 [Protoblastenia rupestris]
MPARLPASTDFPLNVHVTIVPPPPTSPRPTNVLLLLHGLGDTSDPFTNLGKQLNLPETVCISVQGLNPLPFDLGGFHWGDDITFDQPSGQMGFDAGFEKSVRIIGTDIIEQTLVNKCGYTGQAIMMIGFGQGGMAALAATLSTNEEFGGVISIGGPLPHSIASKHGINTPSLILGGSSNTMITRTALERLRSVFKSVEYSKWQRSGDGMPRNYDEMLPIMRFLARRLRSRQGVPDDSMEIG